MAMRLSGWRRLVLRASVEESARSGSQQEPAAREADVARIDAGVEMNGRLVLEQSLCIEGEFRGELTSANGVFVTETGTVEAPIRARTVEIRGAVVGDVVASREIVIFASGRLHGDVETPSLVVERGATFNGRTRMFRPERSLHGPALPARESVATPPKG